jgi:acetoin utilization deacetylase AcuC-like enzyme
VECPARAERIFAAVREAGLGRVIEPEAASPDAILRIHDAAYVRFLETAWREWEAAGHRGEAMPLSWPARDRPSRSVDRPPPDTIVAKLGYYALAADTAITRGTWEAARAAVDVVLTARDRVAAAVSGSALHGASGRATPDKAAFALCRPPGHHAARDLYGGYCFLNNAAIAAQAFVDDGAGRVAVLDIDFHHGNGTQSIFYDRPDVFFLSLHGDPREAFPYYTGYADETGEGDGDGATVNYPMPPGTGYDRWGAALDDACRHIDGFAPDALVVSLGVDAYKGDPISFFALESDDFTRAGERIGFLRLPTLFVMEGGYAVDAIGTNTVNVLRGFEEA